MLPTPSNRPPTLSELDRTPALNTETAMLVVDNDALVRLGTLVMLREMGFAPQSADSLTAALEQVAVHGAPDILVTDYQMPGGSGVELARKLHVRDADLRVLFVTGHDRIEDALEPHWLILQKPFTGSELRDAITELLASQ
jgi:FixJ family two-component response regulator